MIVDTWRDHHGFGRAIEVEPRVWSQIGPDNEDHAVACDFIRQQGILPCNCDATRYKQSEWYQRWLRWATVRARPSTTLSPLKWPIHGPDGDWWVPGIDFNDD